MGVGGETPKFSKCGKCRVWGVEHRWAQDQGTARTTYCFLKTTWGHKLIPHNRSHLPPAKGLEEAHHPLYPAGTRLLSQAAKPERLARARRSKTFQLTSSMSPSAPAIAHCPPPGLPVSTARPAPPPRATLSGGTPAGSELPGRRRPSSLGSWSSEGQPQASVRVQSKAAREPAP